MTLTITAADCSLIPKGGVYPDPPQSLDDISHFVDPTEISQMRVDRGDRFFKVRYFLDGEKHGLAFWVRPDISKTSMHDAAKELANEVGCCVQYVWVDQENQAQMEAGQSYEALPGVSSRQVVWTTVKPTRLRRGDPVGSLPVQHER